MESPLLDDRVRTGAGIEWETREGSKKEGGTRSREENAWKYVGAPPRQELMRTLR